MDIKKTQIGFTAAGYANTSASGNYGTHPQVKPRYRLGDTIRKPIEAVFEALDEEGMNQQLREALVAMATGTVPDFACQKYEDIVLTTQQMVDEANRDDRG